MQGESVDIGRKENQLADEGHVAEFLSLHGEGQAD